MICVKHGDEVAAANDSGGRLQHQMLMIAAPVASVNHVNLNKWPSRNIHVARTGAPKSGVLYE